MDQREISIKKIEKLLEEDENFLKQHKEIKNNEKVVNINNYLTEEVHVNNNLEDKIIIPNLDELNFDNWEQISEKWPSIDFDLFPSWKKADIPVMIGAGAIGAIISALLTDKFDNIHTKNDHKGEIIDKIRGQGHRFKYGHDILNPFEVEWGDYLPEGNQLSLVNKIGKWLRHLFADSFSKEGVPLPGHSYFRDIILKVFPQISQPGNPFYKTFMTLKMRDLTGTAFIVAVMSIYIYGTTDKSKNKFFNYRYTSLVMGALFTSISLGLILQPPSFNWPALTTMLPYGFMLYKVNNKIDTALSKRNIVIDNNNEKLDSQIIMLTNNLSTLKQNNKKLDDVYQNLINQINMKQELIENDLTEWEEILNKDKEIIKNFNMG